MFDLLGCIGTIGFAYVVHAWQQWRREAVPPVVGTMSEPHVSLSNTARRKTESQSIL